MEPAKDRTPLWVPHIVKDLGLTRRDPLHRRMFITKQSWISAPPFAHHCRLRAFAGFNMAADQIPAIRKALFVPCSPDQQNPASPPEDGACNISQEYFPSMHP